MNLTYHALKELRAIGKSEADLRAALMTRPVKQTENLKVYQVGNLNLVEHEGVIICITTKEG
jgi:hypothetical protein